MLCDVRVVAQTWLRERATLRRLKRHFKIMTDNPKTILSNKVLDEFKWELKRAARGYGDADNVPKRALAVIESHEQSNARVAELELEREQLNQDITRLVERLQRFEEEAL